MKKFVFRALARANKVILPKYSKYDLYRLSKVAKLIVAYRYWVTLNALD
jgi:hypothetical protein